MLISKIYIVHPGCPRAVAELSYLGARRDYAFLPLAMFHHELSYLGARRDKGLRWPYGEPSTSGTVSGQLCAW